MILEGLFLLMQLRNDFTNNKNIYSSVIIMRDFSEMPNVTKIPFIFLRPNFPLKNKNVQKKSPIIDLESKRVSF